MSTKFADDVERILQERARPEDWQWQHTDTGCWPIDGRGITVNLSLPTRQELIETALRLWAAGEG